MNKFFVTIGDNKYKILFEDHYNESGEGFRYIKNVVKAGVDE